LYSLLRSATCAALIVFATIIAIGAPVALRLALDQPLVSVSESSEPASSPRRDLPWITRQASNAGAIEVLPSPEVLPREALRKADLFALSGEPEPLATPASVAAERTAVVTTEPEIPAPPPQVESPQREGPAAERKVAPRIATRNPSKPHLTAERQAPQRTRTAKQSTREALGVMRRFDDSLPNLPVTAFSADGAPRRIVIRPTSIQDVYYYSSRR
jgi:hypothetical protein